MRNDIDESKRTLRVASPAFLGSPTQSYIARPNERHERHECNECNANENWKRIVLTGNESPAFLGSPTQGYVRPVGRLQIATVADGVRRMLLKFGGQRTNRNTRAAAAAQKQTTPRH